MSDDRYEPALAEIAEQSRRLAISISQYRVSTKIAEGEVESIEAARVEAEKIVGEISKLMQARMNQVEAAA